MSSDGPTLGMCWRREESVGRTARLRLARLPAEPQTRLAAGATGVRADPWRGPTYLRIVPESERFDFLLSLVAFSKDGSSRLKPGSGFFIAASYRY